MGLACAHAPREQMLRVLRFHDAARQGCQGARSQGRSEDQDGKGRRVGRALPKQPEDGALGEVEDGRGVEAELDSPPERDGEGC